MAQGLVTILQRHWNNASGRHRIGRIALLIIFYFNNLLILQKIRVFSRVSALYPLLSADTRRAGTPAPPQERWRPDVLFQSFTARLE